MVLCWQVSAACGKCIKIMMAKVINIINPQWVGGVRVSGYGFLWYLHSNWTPSVGVSVSSVLHSVV
jgi:hypothetical protein